MHARKDLTRHSHGRRGERGASLVEYALLVALIAVVCIVAVTFVGTSSSDKMGESGSSIDGGSSDVSTTIDNHPSYPLPQGPGGTCAPGYNIDMDTQMCVWAGP